MRCAERKSYMYKYIGLSIIFLSCSSYGFIRSSKLGYRSLYAASFGKLMSYCSVFMFEFGYTAERVISSFTDNALEDCGFLGELRQRCFSGGFFVCRIGEVFDEFVYSNRFNFDETETLHIRSFCRLMEREINQSGAVEFNSVRDKLLEYEKKHADKRRKDMTVYKIGGIFAGLFVFVLLM